MLAPPAMLGWTKVQPYQGPSFWSRSDPAAAGVRHGRVAVVPEYSV